MAVEGPPQDAEGRFAVECLHRTRTPLSQLYAHWGRVCALDPRGDLLVCSAEGAVELASGTDGLHVQCACWSPCGSFLVLGDGLGQIRLFHLPSQADVWTHAAAQVHSCSGGAVPVFLQLCCFEEPTGAPDSVVVMALLASGALLRVGGLALSTLDAELRALAAEGCGALRAPQSFVRGASASLHGVPEDTRHFCVASRLGGPGALAIYTCGLREVCAHRLVGGVLEVLDVAALPELEEGDADDDAADAASAGTPPKRRRHSRPWPLPEGCGRGQASLAGIGLWHLDFHSLAGERLGGRGDAASEALLAVVCREPGAVVLCDPEMLFEVERWSSPNGQGIVSAAPVGVPHSGQRRPCADAIVDDAAEGVRASVAGSALSTSVCVMMDTCELLVCLLPLGVVLFSTRLDFPDAPAALLAAPDRIDSTAAFVCATGAATQDGAPPTTTVSALRYSAEDDAQDRSVDIEELLVVNEAGSADARTTASLRQQMELLIERAAQGTIELRAAPILRLAQQLAGQIPGFVVGSVVRAGFVNTEETRGALLGLLPLLASGALPATYDAKKGASLVSESLARLTTFESLHCALSPPSDAVRSASEPSLPTEARSISRRNRRCSLAECKLGGSPKRAIPNQKAAARRRHSLPSFGRAQALLKEDLLGRSAVELLLQLDQLVGGEFIAAWQHFRRASMPQVCLDLVAVGRVPEAFDVLARHAGRFAPEEAMQVVEALPLELDIEDEARLPHWVAQQAAGLASCRARLVKWLSTRAELLESSHQSPDAALWLLGTVISSALHDHVRPNTQPSPFCRLAAVAARAGAQSFPEARVVQGVLWAGSPPPLPAASSWWAHSQPPPSPMRQASVEDDDSAAGLFELFRQLLCCAYIHESHGLPVRLQDLREPASDRWVAARLLDRALAPELLREEVRAHVGPFCEWQGTCLDDVLTEYAVQLAESFSLPNSEVRLERAAAVLCCMSSVEHRAKGLVKLLQHWRGTDVPVELRPLVAESEAWPAGLRRAVREQLTLVDLQRMLRKYGLGGGCTTYPLYNTRLVHHLLSRVEGDVAPLQDALSILEVFPQHFTRAEALFLCLTHVASAVEGAGEPQQALLHKASLALGCAASSAERWAAGTYFAAYCSDLLGEWACVIQRGEEGAAPAATKALKSSSSALCLLAIGVLHDVLLSSDAATEDSLRQASGVWAVSMFTRLKGLQDRFDLFLDPLAIAQVDAQDGEGSTGPCSEEPPASQIFRQQAASELRGASPEGERLEACSITRLLHLGKLLGLGEARTRQLIFLEASPRGLLSACRALVPKMLECQGPDGCEGLARFAHEALRHVCESKQDPLALRRSSELVLQLGQIEETIVCCLGQCAPSEMAALLELVGDVQLTMETLLSSDLLDTAGQTPELGTGLQDLPISHTHHLGGLLRIRPTQPEPSTLPLPSGSLLHKSFVEIPLLIPGATAVQVGLGYLASASPEKQGTAAWVAPPAELAEPEAPPIAATTSGAPGSQRLPQAPKAHTQLLVALRASECLELAAALLLRRPRSFSGSELRQLCRDRGARVLRAGNGVDNQLAAAYMGCLDARDARDMFTSAVSYLRTEQHQMEHHRLQRLARLGFDLAALWGSASFHAQMSRLETDAKWSQCLTALQVPFDASRLGDGGAALRALTANGGRQPPPAHAAQDSAIHARALVPRLARASRFDLPVVLHFGREHSLPEKEVLALWVEAVFTTLPPSTDVRTLQLLLLPALERLPGMAREELLVARVLPLVSPYSYRSIELLLGLAKDHPLTTPRLQVLQVLEKYDRVSPPSEAEKLQISEWATRAGLSQAAGGHDDEGCLRETQLLAGGRLPWHAVALSGNPWPTLAPELLFRSSFCRLLALAEPLGLDSDEFYVCLLRRLVESGAEALDDNYEREPLTMSGATGTLRIEALVLEVRNTEKALTITAELEDGAPLGPRRIALARSREELARRRAMELGQEDPAGIVSATSHHRALMESRWDLSRSGLGVLDEVLVQHGPGECVSCLYYYLPASLTWLQECSLEEFARQHGQGCAKLVAAAGRLGEPEVHDLADSICLRHGLAPKTLRHQLIEQWLVTPSRRPPGAPLQLADAEAACLARLSGAWRGGRERRSSSSSMSDGSPAARRPRLAAVGDLVGGQMFAREPADLLCLDRVTYLAYPRRARMGQDVPKDVREDVRTRGIFLLRIVFKKEKDVSYDAKCRALEVLFRVASLEEIASAYRNPLEELREIWKLYFYMDAFERLGAPQDFKRFYQCNKDGMARSLWRSHHSDPRMVQVIAALCLDFRVKDSRFWASVLSGLHGHGLREFTRDLLVALHQGLILDLTYDESLVDAISALIEAPLNALSDWVSSGARAAAPHLGGVLPVVPHILRRSPFAEALAPARLAGRLLRLARVPGLPEAASKALARTVFGCPPPHHQRPPAAAAWPISRHDCLPGLLPLPPPTCSSGWGDSTELGALCFEIALCDTSQSRLQTFVCEEVIPHCPLLILDCIQRCSGAVRSTLLQGVIDQQLIGESRLRLPRALFGELVEHAIAKTQISELLEAALVAREFESARRLLARFTQVHRLPPADQLMAQAGEGGGAATASGAARHLLRALRALSAPGAAGGEVLRELLRGFRGGLCEGEGGEDSDGLL